MPVDSINQKESSTGSTKTKDDEVTIDDDDDESMFDDEEFETVKSSSSPCGFFIEPISSRIHQFHPVHPVLI